MLFFQEGFRIHAVYDNYLELKPVIESNLTTKFIPYTSIAQVTEKKSELTIKLMDSKSMERTINDFFNSLESMESEIQSINKDLKNLDSELKSINLNIENILQRINYLR